MSASSSAKKKHFPVPKGYTLHEPGTGDVSREALQQRFEKLEKLITKAQKQQPK